MMFFFSSVFSLCTAMEEMATLLYLIEYNSYFFGIALPNGLTCS